MPQVTSVTPVQEEVVQYELLEFVVDLSANYDNPFDREQVEVQAVFTSPSGKEYSSRGFYYEEYEYTRELPVNTYPFWDVPECEYKSSDWRVRFLPKETGTWTYTLTVKDADGTATWGPETFECQPGKGKGGVKLSANKRAMEYDDGSRYVPLGFNIPWYTLSTYDYYTELAKDQATCLRLFANYRSCALEHNFKGPNPGDECLDTALGDYRGWGLMQMWRLDYILDRLHQRGMKALYTLIDKNLMFATGTGKYLAANGGPCASREEFWGPKTDVNLLCDQWNWGAYEVTIEENLEPDRSDVSGLLQADGGAVCGPLVIHCNPTAPDCTLVVKVHKGEASDHLSIKIDGEEVYNEAVNGRWDYEVTLPVSEGEHTIEIADAGPDNPQRWNNIQLSYVRLLNYREVSTDEKPATYYQQRMLDYLLARYQWHPGLGMWELWNEFDSNLAPWRPFEYEKACKWAEQQLAYLKEHDAQGRPVTISLVNRKLPQELYQSEAVDFVQTRIYATLGKPERWNWWENAIQETEYGKPSLTGEDGLTYDWQSKQSYRNLIWGNALRGSTSLHFVQRHVEELKLGEDYGIAKKLLAEWPVDAVFPVEGTTCAVGRPTEDLVVKPYFTWEDSQRPTLQHVVRADGYVSDERWVNKTISGTKWTTARENNFVVNYREPGEFRFTVERATTAWTNNYVVVEIDGEQVWREAIIDSVHQGQTFSVPVPAGEHVIRIRGDGNECAKVVINAYGFSDYKRQTNGWLLGSRSATESWVWVHNPENELDTYLAGRTPYPVVEPKLKLAAELPGLWQVSVYDTASGKLLKRQGVVARQGELQVQLPTIWTDVLVRAESVEGAQWLARRLGAYETTAVSSQEVKVQSKADGRRQVVICPAQAESALELALDLEISSEEEAVVSVYALASLEAKWRKLLADGQAEVQVKPGEAAVVEIVKRGGLRPEVKARSAGGKALEAVEVA